MATTHTVNATTVKVRHPLGRSIITLGIYLPVWYYKVNAELRANGEDVSPGVAVLAVTLGIVLLVPPLVSLYNTAERIRRVQERAGATSTINAILAAAIGFVPVVGFLQTAYMQSALNAAWERMAGVTIPTVPAQVQPGPV